MTDQDAQQRIERAEDEIDETLQPGEEFAERDQVAQQDFAARGAMMSNALPGGASPFAGAVIGSGGELGMEPEIDEADQNEREASRGRPGDR
jgi:hypothetical protein